jgi:hypothetical protein
LISVENLRSAIPGDRLPHGLVEGFKGSDPFVVFLRSAVSRAYYSVYHPA